MFIAVNARIEDQFEFIQRLWLNDGDRQRLGASRDLIAGSSRSASTAILQVDGGPESLQANRSLSAPWAGSTSSRRAWLVSERLRNGRSALPVRP